MDSESEIQRQCQERGERQRQQRRELWFQRDKTYLACSWWNDDRKAWIAFIYKQHEHQGREIKSVCGGACLYCQVNSEESDSEDKVIDLTKE